MFRKNQMEIETSLDFKITQPDHEGYFSYQIIHPDGKIGKVEARIRTLSEYEGPIVKIAEKRD